MSKRGLHRHGAIKEDRLSDLPVSVIHHILSFLPTSVVIQTSLLSRRWMRIWASLQTFEFICNFEDKDATKLDYFLKFLESCMLQRQRYQLIMDVTITKLKLHLPYVDDKMLINDNWINLCIKCNVKELDIHIISDDEWCYYFPLSAIHGSRTLTTLKLEDVDFEENSASEEDLDVVVYNPISLPSLTTLSLRHVCLDDGMLENLILGCPSIENLHIHYCSGLSNPQISSTNLLFFSFTPDDNMDIRVKASKMKSFMYGSSELKLNRHYGDINLFSCGSITNLTLTNISFSDDWLRALCLKLVFLESLSLERCKGFLHIMIYIQLSKRFSFKLYLGKKMKAVYANFSIPNVCSFSYEGNTLFSFVSVISPKLLETNVKFNNLLNECGTDWYVQLLDFLGNFDHCRMLTIDVSTKTEVIMFPAILRRTCRPPLPGLKHLVIKKQCLYWSNSELRDAAKWLAPSVKNLQIEEVLVKT